MEIQHRVSLFYLEKEMNFFKLLSFFSPFYVCSADQITLIESTWPENLLPIQSRIFPNDLSHAKTLSHCNGIVKTTKTAVDRANGNLWLLDNGSKHCTPKLIVFDLLRGNNEVSSIYSIEIHR